MAKQKSKKLEPQAVEEPAAPETEEPNLGGRPTSFRPEYAREAAMLCKLGATDQELADFFDVTIRTINRWKVVHPEFADALRRGKDVADERVEASLYHRAMGLEYEEANPVKLKKVLYDGDGKKVAEEERVEIVMVKKVIPADTTAAVFWLKNRRAEQWRDIQRHEHGKPGEFEALSNEELDAEIEAAIQARTQTSAEASKKVRH